MNQAGFSMGDNWDFARQSIQGDGPFSTFEHMENYPATTSAVSSPPLLNFLGSSNLEHLNYPFLSHTMPNPPLTTELSAPQLPDIYTPYDHFTSPLPPLPEFTHLHPLTSPPTPPLPPRPDLLSHEQLDDLYESPREHPTEGDKTSKRKAKAPAKKRRVSEKKESSENACPICNKEVDPSQFEAHYALELARLDQVTEKPAEKTREKREAALNARVKVQLQTQALKPRVRSGRGSKQSAEPSLNPEDVLRTVQRNRQTRSNSRTTTAPEADLGSAHQAASVCPICKLRIHGDSDDINRHIDVCLATNERQSQAPPTRNSKRSKRSAEPEEFEVYTIAGQTRVRASSGLEGGYAGTLNHSSLKPKVEDESDELDVDGDDSKEFGQGQYSEGDLLAPVEDESITTTVSSSSLGPNQDSNFVIESLKSRIRDLEQTAGGAGKCLICLGWYNKPCVSIGCWHVLCEHCWLTTLGAKKLCPLCKVITAPDSLRRIFL